MPEVMQDHDLNSVEVLNNGDNMVDNGNSMDHNELSNLLDKDEAERQHVFSHPFTSVNAPKPAMEIG